MTSRSVLIRTHPKLYFSSLTVNYVWRESIQQALGDEAQVLIDIIPQLQQVIGPQPHVVELPPMETNQRLNARFLALVKLFCTAEHPLVLFVDDLQWADAMSLSLLQLLFSQQHMHLLLIGT